MTVSTTTPGVVHYTTGAGATPAPTPTKDSPTETPKTFYATTNVRARSFHPDYATSIGEVTRTYTIKASTPQLSVPEGRAWIGGDGDRGSCHSRYAAHDD